MRSFPHSLTHDVYHPPHHLVPLRGAECTTGVMFEHCTVELCGSAMGFARYSAAAVFMSAAVAGLLVAALGMAI